MLSTLLCATALSANTTITLDFQKPGIQVSPTLYGLFTEEINFSYDGGLYAETIRNRAFRDHPERPVHWEAVGAGASIALDKGGATEALPVSLKVVGAAANGGFWGIPVRPSTTYKLTVWAKADKPGPITASLESKDGQTVFAQATLNGVQSGWTKLETELKTPAAAPTTAETRLVLKTGADRTTWLNLVSLFPPTHKNRPNGFRSDIMELLAAMKPSFMRFPGGNYLQGSRLEDRFPWKTTLGPIENRPGHQTPWGYRSSDGMGLVEFFLWCEDLNMKPVLGVFAGYNLNKTYIPAGPGLQPYVQEALDQIEFLIGGPETPWGARRIADGRREPFDLEYVQIGNEDGFDESGSYEDRFVQYYDAIKAKYPHIKVIASTGGKDWLGGRYPITKRKPDLVDEHYYANEWDMKAMAFKYDDYDRNGPAILVGEWAAHVGTAPWIDAHTKGPTPEMACAVAEAAYMTGLERNSDIVKMACYGPLFVNVNPGGRQWAINLIGHDALGAFGSPSYHAQVMFAQNLGDRTVPLTVEGAPTESKGDATLPGIYSSATVDSKTGALYLKVVNTLAQSQTVTINLQGAKIQPGGTVTVLTGKPTDINTMAEPRKVAPVTTQEQGFGDTFTRTVPATSATVYRLQTIR